MKFLAFEQTFKNALTTYPMGGAKGGSDFNPKGRSDEDIMRFCQAFMAEMCRHIGEKLDVPAGDLGVGKREIGYLYGFYKKLKSETTAAMTSKDISYGGALGRKEATGYGLIYFIQESLKVLKNENLSGKNVVISGSGNVAIYAAYKAVELGANVIAMSDSQGVIYHPSGLDIQAVAQIKEVKRESLKTYVEYDKTAKYFDNSKHIWSIKTDIALPCATENELDVEDAKTLIDNHVMLIGEGANMPCTHEAVESFIAHDIIFAPGKAANAGGVLVSALEIAQNKQFTVFTFEDVNKVLEEKMQTMVHRILEVSKAHHKDSNLLFGSNVYSFTLIADAMIALGVV